MDGQSDRHTHKEQFLNKIGSSSLSLQYNDRLVIYLQMRKDMHFLCKYQII